MADSDVLCLQEVARNFPGLPGPSGKDQFRLLAEMLPGYAAIEGIGTDVRGSDYTPRQFGNLILTRLPVRLGLDRDGQRGSSASGGSERR